MHHGVLLQIYTRWVNQKLGSRQFPALTDILADIGKDEHLSNLITGECVVYVLCMRCAAWSLSTATFYAAGCTRGEGVCVRACVDRATCWCKTVWCLSECVSTVLTLTLVSAPTPPRACCLQSALACVDLAPLHPCTYVC